MKNNIIFLLLLPFASLFAQDDYGLRNVAGGQFSLYFSKHNGGAPFEGTPNASYFDNPNRIVAVQPYAAWKVGRNMLLGFRLGFRNELQCNSNLSPGGVRREENQFLNTYAVGAFSRHFLSPEKALRFFMEPYLAYSRIVYKEDDADGNKERIFFINDYQLSVSPGITYQLSPHFGLLAKIGQVGVHREKSKNGDGDYENWSNDFFADFNLASFALGLEYRW